MTPWTSRTNLPPSKGRFWGVISGIGGIAATITMIASHLGSSPGVSLVTGLAG